MTVKLNALSIVVDDMAAALAFYRALGIDIPASADAEPHAEVALDGGMRLMFDTVSTVKSFMPSFQKSSGTWGSLALECSSAQEVDRLYEAMTAAGHHGELSPWDAFWGQRYAVLHDPDGNGVDLYAALPG